MADLTSGVFCPNCAAKNDIKQNFCRFCGLNLRETADSLAAQLSHGKNARELKRLQRLKKVNEYASIGLTIIICGAVGIAIHALITKTLFPGARVFPVLVVLFLITESVEYFLRRRARGKISGNEETEPSPANETTKLLDEKPFAPARSVTENSTELLLTKNKTREFE